MSPSTGRNTGAQRTNPNKPSFTPYGHWQSQERGSGAHAMTTRSQGISRLPRPGVLGIPHSLSQFTPSLSPVKKLQANATTHLAPPRRLIEQVPYAPVRNQAEFTHVGPVSFSMNGVLGFSVARAVAGEFTGLDEGEHKIFSFEGNKASFRIQFIGHDLYSPKINTRRHVAGWAPITRCKLAKEIGKKVKEYIEKQGLQATFAFEKIYLARLTRVSKGSWQAELLCEDTVAPGPSA